MASMWYYAREGDKLGPFSPSQLKDLADTGAILSSDTIWKEGVEQGVLASRVKNLFPRATSDVPPIIVDAMLDKIIIESTLTEPDPDKPPPLVVAENLASTPPGQAAAKPVQSRTPQRPANKARAVALKGADIVSQDGTQAKYRKKCTVCGHNDSSCHTITITNKMLKANFFCPKCRKRRDVAIQCYS